MKDIKFSGGALTNQVTLRVDSINGTNLTVLETYGLNDRQPAVIDTDIERKLIADFPKRETNLIKLEQFAESNGLNMSVSETNGSNEVTLKATLTVLTPAASSSTSDTTPNFSGKGTPGATVVVTIASASVNTIVKSDGTWSVDFSTLTTGAKSAVVTLVKDGVSAAPVTRAFTIS